MSKNENQDRVPWLVDLSRALVQYANEYPDYHVVTHLILEGDEETIPGDVRIRSPLIDLDSDDRAVRFITRGLRKRRRPKAGEGGPLRLTNLALRLERMVIDFPHHGAAFVEAYRPGQESGFWFVYPVNALTLRFSEEEKLVCILATMPRPSRWDWLVSIKTSIRRIWVGMNGRYEDD